MEAALADPLTSFFDGIRSSVTKSKYQARLGDFFRFCDMPGKNLNERARSFAVRAKDGAWVERVVFDWIRVQKRRAEEKEISESTLPSYVKPIRLFCDMNDITVNWRKVYKTLPRGRTHAQDRAPDLEEVTKLLQYGDRRMKPMVLVMLSSGIRLGAWDGLRVGDLTQVRKEGKIVAARLVIYRGTPEEYVGFVTPEAYDAVVEYLDYRRQAGEEVTPSSPILRNLFYPDRGSRPSTFAKIVIPLRSGGVKRLMEDALWRTGLRKPLTEGTRRHEFEGVHGLRKYFKTHAEQAMKPINVEILMGHSVGVSDSYYRPKEADILEDYLRAVPLLTVTDQWRRAVESEEKVKEQDDSTKGLVASLATQNQHLQEQVKILAERLSKTEAAQIQAKEDRKKTDGIMNRLFKDVKFRKAVREALERLGPTVAQ